MSTRTRFAPSPTGHVHIGNMRAAIFNWLYARHTGGQFLLRVEDTDRERSTPEAIKTLLEAMSWLGLNVDEEPLYQSTRMAAHLAAAEKLLADGPDKLTAAERLLIMADEHTMVWLHRQSWLCPRESLGSWWRAAIREFSRQDEL